MQKRIYLDYASATPLDPRVFVRMRSIESKVHANPDSLYKEGREAKKVLEEARKISAEILRARPSEIIFTSGATESNNLAILGVFSRIKNAHIITSTIEHKSILEPIRHLESLGAGVTYIHPNADGVISPKDISKALRPETALVSIGYANSEIGTIQPIAEIAKEIRHFRKLPHVGHVGVVFHTDATQAANYLSLDVQKLGVDLLTLNSPKVYGPAGIGALYIKKGTKINPITFGGGQESGMRSGRELPLLASGFAEALKIADKEREKESKRLTKLRDYFFKKILEIDTEIKINGDRENRLPNNVNICVKDLDAEFAVYQMDERGIACSSASTCTNLSEDSISYVVEEIKPAENCAASSLRFSLGRYTTKSEIDVCLKSLKDVILKQQNLWSTSPSSKRSS
ncbi:MAG: cysteine desulfurase family protein [Patescibacteria group bacterium]